MGLEERKQRWLQLYEGKRRTVVLIEQADFGIRPVPSPQTMDAFLNWTVRRYEVQRDSLAWLDDDRIPYVTAGMGTDIFAGAFGCPVYYPGNSNPFAGHLIYSSKELAKLKQPKLEDSSLMEVMEFGHKLRKAAPEALIQLPDIQSPLDIAALIWDKTDFFMSMYDEPEAVKDLISMVTILLCEFLDLWFKTFGKEFIAHYPEYYMPWGITLSEDEIGSLSAEHFREFSWPTLCDLSAQFGDKIGIHCCANAQHQWELFKAIPNLVLLNLVQPSDIIREASIFFRDGPPIWAAHARQNECHDFGSRAVLLGNAETKEEAKSELARLREYGERFTSPQTM